MRWAKEQRMKFITERLRSVGRINRSDLAREFRISSPQASADLKTFQGEYPGVMRYDLSAKCFVLAGKFPAEPGRDTTAAAKSLAAADDAWLLEVAHRDPSMIRDVAAALLFERT